jgi:hypothetical protein
LTTDLTKKEGERDCAELLKNRTIEILKTHKPKLLPEEVLKELRKMETGWLKRVGLTEYPKNSD